MLLVCTANQCRSPMAEGLLRRRLELAALDAVVGSAGLLPGGAPAHPGAVAALARWGIDISGHRSRRLAPELVAGADLVIGMERRHVREAVVADPASLPRTFTLRELVRAGEAVGPRPVGVELPAWLAGMASADRRRLLAGAGGGDLDIADPVGGPARGYERTAAQIDDLLGKVVALVWPAARACQGARAERGETSAR